MYVTGEIKSDDPAIVEMLKMEPCCQNKYKRGIGMKAFHMNRDSVRLIMRIDRMMKNLKKSCLF